MAKERDGEEGREEEREERRRGGRRRRQRESGFDPVKLHEEYLRRHLDGGAPASPQAYARAIEQWHRLPGSIRMSGTEISSTEDVDASNASGDTTERDEPSVGGPS